MGTKVKLGSSGTPEISGVPGGHIKQKFIHFYGLQKLFSKDFHQMVMEIKAPLKENKKKKKSKKNLKLF